MKELNKTTVSKLRTALKKISREKLSENGIYVDDDYSIVWLNGKMLEILKENKYTLISLDLIKYSYKTKKCYVVLQERIEKKKKENFEIKF